jgi:surface antigen
MQFRKPILLTMAACMAATSLVACTPEGGLDAGDLGTLGGAGAGAFLGSRFGKGGGQTAFAVVGALAGAWAGKKIAENLTAQDRHYYDQAATQAQTAPVGQAITWYNPQSGAQGSITPTREGQSNDGAYCREYQQTISVGGQTQRAYGQACRQPDGSWKIVN